MNKLPRILIAGFLVLCVALQSPAWALRPEKPSDSPRLLEEIRAGLEEPSQLEVLADQMLKQAVTASAHFQSLKSWDRQTWEKSWIPFDALYQRQLALLQEAGLLERVIYPASGVDLRMMDASESILLIDGKIDAARLQQALEETVRSYGLVFSDSFRKKLALVRPIAKPLGEALLAPEFNSFIQDRSEAHPATLMLRDFSDWYNFSDRYQDQTLSHQGALEALDLELSSGDFVIIFEQTPQAANFFRRQGYENFFSGRVADALEQVNKLLAVSLDKLPASHFYGVPWSIRVVGLNMALARPMTVLRKSAPRPGRIRSETAGLEEPPVPEELEVPELPEASAYQVIPLGDVMEFLVSLTRDEKRAFLNRLLIEKDPAQKGHDRHYLVKWTTLSKTAWHDKDDPAREYLFSHLVRELGGDVTDVVIPDLDERRRLAEFYGVADPNDLYLVELSEDYSVEDREAVPEPDPDAAFTRDFGIAVLLRMYDFREKNFGPIRGSSTRMMFDGDQAFSPDAEEIGPFALVFAINYWDLPDPGKDDLLKIDPNRLLGRLHLDELQRLVKTVHDFREKRLQEIVEQAPPHLRPRMRKLIRPLHDWLQSYRSDLVKFLELFTDKPQSEFWHPTSVSLVVPASSSLAITTQQVRQALARAGLEERVGQVAKIMEEAADRGRVVVLSAAALEEQPILEAVISRFSGLEEQVVLYGDSPAARELARLQPKILRAHTAAELSDAFGWLVARGPVEQVTYLGGLEEGRTVQMIAREWGLASQVVPTTLVRLLAAFVPEPLAQTLAAGLEESALLGTEA